jgi:hypothetical protein
MRIFDAVTKTSGKAPETAFQSVISTHNGWIVNHNILGKA